MRYLLIHSEPEALITNEKCSVKRELFIEKQQLAPCVFKFDKPEAWECFHKLPSHVLPPLPHGYQWVKSNKNYSAIKNSQSPHHELDMVIYGPDKKNQINILFSVDKHPVYSFAHTKNEKLMQRRYPMSNNDYKVSDYNYTLKKYKSHIRGHLIDHKDTINQGQQNSSTYHSSNYVPEPPVYEWGLGFRNQKIREVRSNKGVYAQFNTYSEHSLVTNNGTLVPEDARLYIYQNDYSAQEIYHIDFEENLPAKSSKIKYLDYGYQQLMSTLDSAPIVSVYSPFDSDRSLRLESRKLKIKEQNILNGNIVPRYAKRDQLFAVCSSGDKEFEAANRQLHAGIFANDKKDLSRNYIRRSRFFADSLAELDEDSPFSEKAAQEGRSFFSKHKDKFEEDYDHIIKLWSDFNL